MKGCIQHVNNNGNTDYLFSIDKNDFNELVKNGEIESNVYSDGNDITKKQLLITLHVDLKYGNEAITEDLDSIKMKFSYKLMQMLMKNDKETYEYSNNLHGDKLIFFIKDSYQKLRLDHNLKTAKEKTSK